MLRIKEKYRRLVFFISTFGICYFTYRLQFASKPYFFGFQDKARYPRVLNAWDFQANVLVNMSHIMPAIPNLQSQKEFAATTAQRDSTNMEEPLNISVKVRSHRPILTLFTTWTEETNRYRVHNVTIRNWESLKPHVIPVVFTNHSTIADECRRHGWDVLPVRYWANGEIPVLKYMFLGAISVYNTTFYGYSNSDILFTDTLIETLAWIHKSVDLKEPVMIVGKRTNVGYISEKDIVTWKKLTDVAKARGKVFRGLAEDYFITSRSYPWKDIPEVVIGRPAFDNWLVYNARKQNQRIIDATRTILAVHQTTRAGNVEGLGRPNSSYNRNLLKNLYGSINYYAGFVDCVNLITIYDQRWKAEVNLYPAVGDKPYLCKQCRSRSDGF